MTTTEQTTHEKGPRPPWLAASALRLAMSPLGWPGSARLTREGWYYLVVFGLVLGGAVMREVNLLLILAGMLAGPLLLGWWAIARSLRGLVARRHVPEGACAGDLIVARIQLESKRARLGCWAVVVEDRLERIGGSSANGRSSRGKPVRPAVLFPYVPAGQSCRATYRGRLTERGRYRLGPLRLSTRFPFGLMRKTISAGGAEVLTIYPRLGQLTQRWMTRRHEAFSGTHRRELKHGSEGDFQGVRPWRAGDPMRWIHWRSTARLGEPVVRQFEQPRNRDLALVVELWQSATPTPAERENVELAVSFAATVVADLCRRGGSDLLLATAGRQPSVLQGPTSAALMHSMMEQLAVVESRPDDHLPDLLHETLRRIDPGTELVLVSTRPVRLDDAVRFAGAGAEPGCRAVLRRARLIDVSHNDLEAYYRAS
ncbi:MAG: DUF58 domain-containing protein [Patescibacteria group bacterium]|nr:DUF58 domain-containing protein [Patescibacteria group bacterium]